MATRPPSPEEQGKLSVEELAKAARDCTACDLHKTGTQTVFGEGGPESKLMFVGEQPGDQEDKAGHPFVGPAGRMLDKALEAEIAALKPKVIVCLGATAAQALLGRAFRVTQQRGEWVESPL
ncbi:MAG TPA: uracil-DNA glycosylase, partial [Myxococcales bacterium]|nr:uracil-DNA glycosylase [Myxococcales bacterium]